MLDKNVPVFVDLNLSIDARMGDQTRFQRWEGGLIIVPSLISERDKELFRVIIDLAYLFNLF